MLPINHREVFELFERYNKAIWPLQLFAYVIGAISALVTVSSHRFAALSCLGSHALLWGFPGVGYDRVFLVLSL